MPAKTSTPGASHRTYSFGEFTLDVDRGALLSAGEDIKLRPKSFEVLSYLVQHHGRLVSKDELLDAIWGSTVVTEDSVTQCLIDIRRALHDQSQKTIRTVPRRGYVFEVAVKMGGGPATGPSLASPTRIIISLLFIAVVLFAYEKWPDPAPAENSIAVLPFKVCEDRVSDLPLAGGLTGAVFTRLAQRDRLKVMGRHSIETVVESLSSMTSISELLGVEYLLSGTVCRDGLDLSLRVELTDSKGFVVWAQDFAQVVNRFDQVEEQLAVMVDNAVAAELGDVVLVPTGVAVDRRALEQLLVGQEYSRQGDKDEARAALEKALELQPDYAEALYELALLENADRPLDNHGDARKQAIAIAERALASARAEVQRNPQSFKANWVAGQVLHVLAYWDDDLAYREFDTIGEEGVAERRAWALARDAEAERFLRAAIAINPSETEVHFWLAYAMDNQGVERRKESLEILQLGLEVDPFNANLSKMAATRLIEFGRFREAMELLDRFEVLPQGKRDVWGWQLEVLNNNGRYDEQLALLIEIMHSDVHVYDRIFPALGQLWRFVSSAAYLGLSEEAEELYAVVDELPDPGPNPWWRQHFFKDFYLYATDRGDEVAKRKLEKIAGLSNEEILKAWLPETATNAMAFWEIGERERAIELAEAMQLFPHEPSRWSERQMQIPMLLVDWYMQLGREDAAVPVLQRVVAHLQAEVDAGARHPESLMLLASAYGWQGNVESALDMLDLAVDYDGYALELCCEDYFLPELEERVWWGGLESDPRFIQSSSRMRAIVDMQRSNIRSLLIQNDIEQLLAPLIPEPEQGAD